MSKLYVGVHGMWRCGGTMVPPTIYKFVYQYTDVMVLKFGAKFSTIYRVDENTQKGIMWVRLSQYEEKLL